MNAVTLRAWRDSAFRLLAAALFIATFALTTMVLLNAELAQRFAVRTAEFLGGDLQLSGSQPPLSQQTDALAGARHTLVVDFSTVVVHTDRLLLVSARAVDNDYPLYGVLQVANDRFAPAAARQRGPAPGELWVGDQVLDQLGIAVGARLTVGNKELTVAGVIRQLPDQGGGFYSMNPRILLHRDDLAATGVLGPGTRVLYRLLVGAPARAITAIHSGITSTLRPDQRLEQVADAAVRSMGPLRQLTLWANLGVLLISLLCGATIYLATVQRVRRRTRLAGLLRAFGAQRKQLVSRLLGADIAALLPVTAMGIALGVGTITLLQSALTAGDLDGNQTLAASTGDWMAVIFSPLLLWLAFSFPQLIALTRIPAMHVLQQRVGQRTMAATLALLGALSAPVVLAALLTRSLADLGQLLLVLAGLGTLLPALLWPLLKGFDLASQRLALPTRLAVRRLSRRPALTLPLMATLTLAMAVLALAGQTGHQLLTSWRAQLPTEAPNYFILNLFDRDRETLRRWMAEHGAQPQELYPVMRGRLTEINQVPVREAITKESNSEPEALNRDLILTQAARLPNGNRVQDGQWHTEDGSPITTGVSVEQELAQKLGLKLGDNLQFVSNRGAFHSTVTSVREVDWETFAPNFYFIFSPGSLANQDITWLTSFWLPPGDGARLAQLLRQLPHITLLDINALLDKAQGIVGQASRAVFLLATLLMLAALLVLATALLGGRDRRARDYALARTLGARQQLLQRTTWTEFLILGGGSAMCALVAVQVALYPLSERLFAGEPAWSMWQLLPLIAALLVVWCGVVGSRAALDRPSASLLREQGD